MAKEEEVMDKPRSLEEFYTWFKANVPESNWKESGSTVWEALNWMVSYWEAENLIQDLTIKELARYLWAGDMGRITFVDYWKERDPSEDEELTQNILKFFQVKEK